MEWGVQLTMKYTGQLIRALTNFLKAHNFKRCKENINNSHGPAGNPEPYASRKVNAHHDYADNVN